MVKWTAAVVAGGGVAGLTQGVTGILRAHSTVLTGGLGNAVFSTAELGGAVFKTSPVEFGKYLADQTAKWASVVRFANIKAQ